MNSVIRIGTRESELAVWQATLVKDSLEKSGYESTLVYIKSDGDVDLKTPLYEMGVQGIFTKSLDIALLNDTIDMAVHSMKDVPTQLPTGIVQAAVLKRGNYRDLFVFKNADLYDEKAIQTAGTSFEHAIATSSIRRKAQWLNRYPGTVMENLRGNVNSRMRKLAESNWTGAIFAAAGLERIGLRPTHSIELDWMLPAPAQGAIMVVGRANEEYVLGAAATLHDELTATCTRIERDFLRELMGGCSTPISALAIIEKDMIHFKGNILSVDGTQKVNIEEHIPLQQADGAGKQLALELLQNGGKAIADSFKHAG
ncbi:MAG TPA: hydroxymethylbilane synthase [Ferruginibacter sp.]|nr:hydroxymethylbilane synthase [Ferruginibacter sp.]